MVHKYFHEVLEAMMKFAKEMMALTTFDSNMDILGAHNKRLRRIFKGAISALDGTLVHPVVPANQQIIYRGRGKNNGFPFPPSNKYYLCDVAYSNIGGFLAPYRNVRYWLGYYCRTRAITKEEKFNHAYAQLRNVIKRSYGVLKARFPILNKMAPYPINIQRDVVIACFAVNNFIRKERINDELFNQFDTSQVIFDEEEQQEKTFEETNGPSWTVEDSQIMHSMREELAFKLMH
ncbi:hypothetical protein P3S67_015934 [Capsicum chacoense]